MLLKNNFKDVDWSNKRVILIANHSEFSLVNPAHPINLLARQGAEVWVAIRRTASTRPMFESNPNVSGVLLIEGVQDIFSTIKKLRSITFDAAFFYSLDVHFHKYTPHLCCFFVLNTRKRYMLFEKEGEPMQMRLSSILPSLFQAFYPYVLMSGDLSLAVLKSKKKKSELEPNSVKRILLIRVDHIGDMVISSSVIDALKDTYPKAELDLLLNPTVSQLFLHDPRINKIYTFKAPWYARSPSTEEIKKAWKMLRKDLLPKLRKNKYTIAIDCHGDLFDSWIAYKSLARYRYGLISPYHNKGILTNSFFLTHPIYLPAEQKLSEAELKDFLAKSLGYKGKPLLPRIIWNQEDTEAVNKIVNVVPKDFHTVAVHASSSKRITQWPLNNYQEALLSIAKNYDNKVAFFFLGAQTEYAINEKIIEVLKGQDILAINLAGTCSLLECAALCSQVDLFLGNDSGPMHLAAASGARVVALYIPVFAPLYAPRGEHHRFIIADENGGIETIPTDIVIKTVQEELNKTQLCRHAL